LKAEIIFRLIKILLVIFMFSVSADTHARAGLILGTSQFGTKQAMNADEAVQINLSGFGGRFFGQSVSNIWIAENGYLSKTNISGGDYVSTSLAIDNNPRIASFWDDVFVIPDASGTLPQHGVFFAQQAGQYIAATWSQVFLFNDLVAGEQISNQLARSFQTVWFEANATLGNFQFKKDDIAMGFSGFSDGNIDAVVGIRDESQYFTIDDVMGGAPGGVISTNSSKPGFPNAQLLPWEDDRFLLFRAIDDDAGNFSHYQVSIESFSAVPEPASWLLIGASAGAMWWLRRRRG